MGSGRVVRRALFPAFTQFFKTVQVTAYERIFLESEPGFELVFADGGQLLKMSVEKRLT
jgi:hypothetical protein